MANFEKAFKKLKGIEFSNSSDVLGKNPHENGLTYYGIYQSAHPKWEGWKIVKKCILDNNGSRRAASRECYANDTLNDMVKSFYKKRFWDKLRLDEIKSQKIAEEMFFFYMNTGKKKLTIKKAQEVIGVKADGILGPITLGRMNQFDDHIFDKSFDDEEIEYYEDLVASNPRRYKIFLKGWKRRARLI